MNFMDIIQWVLGTLLPSPAGQMGMTALGAHGQSQAQDEATAANEEQYQNILRMYEEGRHGIRGWQQEGFKEENELLNLMRDYLNATTETQRDQVLGGYKQREGDVMSGFNNLLSDVMGGYDQRTKGVMGPFGDLQREVQQGYQQRETDIADILAGLGGLDADYGERRDRAMANLAGLGEQAKADITKQYEGLAGQLAQQMMDKGMTGTTVMPALQMQLAGEESAEQRRLSEDLARERITWDSLLSGEQLAAQERVDTLRASFGAQLSGDTLASLSNLGMFGANLGAGLTGESLAALQNMGMYGTGLQADISGQGLSAEERLNAMMLDYNMALMGGEMDTITRQNQERLNWFWNPLMQEAGFMEGVTNEYPDAGFFANLMQQFGYNAAPTPNAPNWFQSGGGGAIAGGAAGGLTAGLTGAALSGGGGLAGLGAKIFFGCIDSNAIVTTLNGARCLKDVEIGDSVLCSNGNWVHVMGKDDGIPHPQRANDYIRLMAGGSPITLTKDHVIGGKPAGDWKVGEEMEMEGGSHEVTRIEPVGPVRSGDLILDEPGEYVANGFFITPVLTREMAEVGV